VYTPTLKKHQVVRDLKKFENHWCSGIGTAFQHLFFSTVPLFNRHDLGFLTEDKAGSTIGQTGQMPGASRLNIKRLVYWFFRYLGCPPRVNIVELFLLLRLLFPVVKKADNFGIYYYYYFE